MAIITKEEIRKLARISNLEIHEDEIDTLTKQIEAVLSYAARVQEIAQQASFDQSLTSKNMNVWREDVIIKSNSEQILAQSPAKEERYFVVPAIIEHK